MKNSIWFLLFNLFVSCASADDDDKESIHNQFGPPKPAQNSPPPPQKDILDDIFGWNKPKPPPKPLPPPKVSQSSNGIPELKKFPLTDSKDYLPLNEDEKKEMIRVIGDLETILRECQGDVIERFSMCSVDAMVAKKNGTLKTLLQPYQVGYGRLTYLKLHANQLGKLLKDKEASDEAIAQSAVRFRLRLIESANFVYEVSTSKKHHFNRVGEKYREMNRFQEIWLPEASTERGERAILWNLVVVDSKNWIENSRVVKRGMGVKEQKLIDHNALALTEVLKDLGTTPWNLSTNRQRELARKIEDVSDEITARYEAYAEEAELCLGKPQFESFAFFLGANQNLKHASKNVLLQ